MVEVDGRFAVYFNRHQAAPLVWCIALLDIAGSPVWELAVSELVIEKTTATARYRPGQSDDSESGIPSAVIECSGRLTVLKSGFARITGLPR